jgi:mono/diheme cytochrome c family protein
MKTNSRLLPVLVTTLLTSAAGSAWADDAQIAAGSELYAEFCENCHGANKSGLTEFKDDSTTFTDRLEGMTQEMPDFAGFFEEDEIAAMYAYMSASDAGEE